MDWTNRLINIQNKMKSQLHAKKIDDLEYLYALIEKFDKDRSGALNKDEF
jgi:calcyphosin